MIQVEPTAGQEKLVRTCGRSEQRRLFETVVEDVERATLYFRSDVIDEGTLLGVLRDRLGALEQLAQGQVAS